MRNAAPAKHGKCMHGTGTSSDLLLHDGSLCKDDIRTAGDLHILDPARGIEDPADPRGIVPLADLHDTPGHHPQPSCGELVNEIIDPEETNVNLLIFAVAAPARTYRKICVRTSDL